MAEEVSKAGPGAKAVIEALVNGLSTLLAGPPPYGNPWLNTRESESPAGDRVLARRAARAVLSMKVQLSVYSDGRAVDPCPGVRSSTGVGLEGSYNAPRKNPYARCHTRTAKGSFQPMS